MNLENYHMVCLWAVGFDTGTAMREIQGLKQKYPWLKCDQSLSFIKKMHEDMPKILNIVKFQESRMCMLMAENAKLHGYIKANGMADECIINAIRDKFKIDL